jgi:hypothetical protein
VGQSGCYKGSGLYGSWVLPTAYEILANILLLMLNPYAEEIVGDHQCGFRRNCSTIDLYFAFVTYLRKNGNTTKECIGYVFFKKAYDSVGREVLYNILIEFGIPMKLARQIKMCLTETCSRLRVGKHLSAMFPITNGLK